MFTAPQFIYVTVRQNEEKIVFLSGTCRFCGGSLFRDDRYGPYVANENNFSLRVAGLAKDKSSSKMCPACRYIYANLNNTAGEMYRENKENVAGIFKYMPKRSKEEKSVAVHGIFASKKDGFIQYGDWIEFGKALCNPPETPFVAMATEDKKGFLYSIWKAVVSYSRNVYPVVFVRSRKITKEDSVSMVVTAWIDREKFARAVDLMARYKQLLKKHEDYLAKCGNAGIKAERIPYVGLPDSPDWQLAYRCAPEAQ